jgi:hypothetical protein
MSKNAAVASLTVIEEARRSSFEETQAAFIRDRDDGGIQVPVMGRAFKTRTRMGCARRVATKRAGKPLIE